MHTITRDGALGPTLSELYESRTEHVQWRQRVADMLAERRSSRPVYIEALLARRWFVPVTARRVAGLMSMSADSGRPFVEVLLHSVLKPSSAKHRTGSRSETVRGTRFEAAAALLLSATPGFEVHEARRTSDEQVDLVVRYTPQALATVGLDPGPGLVECKSSEARVTVDELRSFGAKCMFHRVGFGILVSRVGLTGREGDRERAEAVFREPRAAELTRRRFQADGLHILVLDVGDLRGRCRELRGLAEPLAEDLRRLVFGPRG